MAIERTYKFYKRAVKLSIYEFIKKWILNFSQGFSPFG